MSWSLLADHEKVSDDTFLQLYREVDDADVDFYGRRFPLAIEQNHDLNPSRIAGYYDMETDSDTSSSDSEFDDLRHIYSATMGSVLPRVRRVEGTREVAMDWPACRNKHFPSASSSLAKVRSGMPSCGREGRARTVRRLRAAGAKLKWPLFALRAVALHSEARQGVL